MSPASLVIASLAIVLAPGPPKAPGRWLGVFTPVKGARELCSQHVLGGATAQTRVEIAFTLYATTTPTADVIRFYAAAHKQTAAPDASTLTVRADKGHKVLSVHHVGADYPTCGVSPRPDEPTVIVVSESTPG